MTTAPTRARLLVNGDAGIVHEPSPGAVVGLLGAQVRLVGEAECRLPVDVCDAEATARRTHDVVRVNVRPVADIAESHRWPAHVHRRDADVVATANVRDSEPGTGDRDA